jgi:hypothetical protein
MGSIIPGKRPSAYGSVLFRTFLVVIFHGNITLVKIITDFVIFCGIGLTIFQAHKLLIIDKDFK